MSNSVKKKIVIIVMISVLILAVLGAWIYLLMNGAPQTEEAPRNTEFGSATTRSGDGGVSGFAETPQVTPVDEQALIQLTDTPVAGAVLLYRNDEPFVRYVEKGTGHVFEIALTSGEETQLSGTTIQKVVDAVWAPSGNRVALTIEEGAYETEVFLAHVIRNDEGENVLEGYTLERGAHSLAFDDVGNTLFYAVSTNSGTVGYAEEMTTAAARMVQFDVPFTQVHVLWGDPIHVYNKPSATLEGFLYEVSGSSLTQAGIRGPGLSAKKHDGRLLVSTSEENKLTATLYDTNTGSTTLLGIAGYTEKCAFTRGTSTPADMWCVDPTRLPEASHPDDWYQGVLSFTDQLWRVDFQSGESRLISAVSNVADEPIDAIDVTIDPRDRYIMFINKNDRSLWLYNTTIEQ